MTQTAWPTRRMFTEMRIKLIPDNYTPKYIVQGKTRGFFSHWVTLGRFYCSTGEEEVGLRHAQHAANHYWENHG